MFVLTVSNPSGHLSYDGQFGNVERCRIPGVSVVRNDDFIEFRVKTYLIFFAYSLVHNVLDLVFAQKQLE